MARKKPRTVAEKINESMKSTDRIVKNLNKAFRKKMDVYKQAWAEIEAFLNSGVMDKMTEIHRIKRERPEWNPEQILRELGCTKKDLANLRKVIKAMKKGRVMC